MRAADVIAAVSTPPGRGGIGIVRISGKGGEVKKIAERILNSPPPPPRRAARAQFFDGGGELIDDGIAVFFPAPASFTGEDVLELHGHGGGAVMEMLLARCLSLGARAAQPGEFSLRAFLNGKTDLAQAEAVNDLINAQTEAAARAARRAVSGNFSREIETAAARIAKLRALAEAGLDFADEDIAFAENETLKEKVNDALAAVRKILKTAREGRLWREGISVAIVGPANAGKSSLFNVLCGEARAIVSKEAGTTRDLLHENITIHGVCAQLTDTAGWRETENEVEKIGLERARAVMEDADLALWVCESEKQPPATFLMELEKQCDSSADSDSASESEFEKEESEKFAPLVVVNKIDLRNIAAGERDGKIWISAKTGAGVDDLRAAIARRIGLSETPPPYLARQRHIRALQRAAAELARARARLPAPELFAEHLRLAHNALGEITGAADVEDILGDIFANFCIGK